MLQNTIGFRYIFTFTRSATFTGLGVPKYIQYTYLLNYMPSTKCYVFCTTNVSRIQIWSPWDKYMREFDVELIYNSVELCLYILIYV